MSAKITSVVIRSRDLIRPPSASIIETIRENWSIFFFLVGIVGIFGIAESLSILVVKAVLGDAPLGVNQYLLDFFWYPDKPYEIARYCLSVAGTVLYISWIVLLNRRRTKARWNFPDYSWFNLVLMSLCWMAVNILLYRLSSRASFFIIGPIAVAWTILLNLPFWTSSKTITLALSSKKLRVMSLTMLAAATVEFVYIFQPFIFSKPTLINEFFEVPEKTLLWKSQDITGNESSRGTDPRIVDNFSYDRDHEIFRSMTLQAPSTGGHIAADSPSDGIEIEQSLALDEFIKRNDSVSYDSRTHHLYVVSPLTPVDTIFLCSLLMTPEKKSALLRQEASLEQFRRQQDTRRYTPEELEYIQENRREIHEQILNRWVIHHHSHMLSPMNELLLGRPLNEIHFLYGFPNAWLLEKMITGFAGDLTYQAYIHISYAFYYVYFLLFILLCYSIFRDHMAVSLCALGAAAAFAASGFDDLMLGPGFNPLRHMLDLPTIYLIWQAVRSSARKAPLYWTAALVLCLASIYNNTEFGIILSLSWIGCFLWFSLMELKSGLLARMVLPILAAIAAIAFCVESGKIGSEGYGAYFMRGMMGFPIHDWRLIPMVVMCGIMAWILMSNWNDPEKSVAPSVKLMCFLFLLSAQSFTYYIWNPEKAHILTLLPVFIILLVMMARHLTDRYSMRNLQRAMPVFLSMSFVLFAITALISYQMERSKYYHILSSHQVFAWSFPRMEVDTTMDPAPFQASIDMINRVSKDPGIHIISKYDSIIPFLSNHYSQMKYFELSQFMITRLEVAKVIEALQKDHPTVLYVDSDIDTPKGMDIITPGGVFGYLHDESRWRAMRLDLLREVFDHVKGDYQLDETGPLISVWRRRI